VGIVSDSDITFAVPALLSNMDAVYHGKLIWGNVNSRAERKNEKRLCTGTFFGAVKVSV